MQQEPFKFDPATGNVASVEAVRAAHYRDIFDLVWNYNPWTGGLRHKADVESDPRGHLIHDGVSPFKVTS